MTMDELIKKLHDKIDILDPYFKHCKDAGITNPNAIAKMVNYLKGETQRHDPMCWEAYRGRECRCGYHEARKILKEAGIEMPNDLTSRY